MSTIVTRASKGAPLSWAEADANLNNLNTDKLEASALAPYATTASVTAGLAAKINTTAIGTAVQAYSSNLDEYAAVNPTSAGLALLDDTNAAAQRATLGLVIGTDVQAYDADIPTVAASQAEMEAGTETALRSMSPLRVKQAITAATSGGVKIASQKTSSVATGTALIPYDDTIPQISEGTQFLSLDYTPQNASSTLEIEATLYFSHSAGASGARVTAALFQDSGADALCAGLTGVDNTQESIATLSFRVSAGSTTARTYTVRAGGNVAGTLTINGGGGARRLGGVLYSSLVVKEYLP